MSLPQRPGPSSPANERPAPAFRDSYHRRRYDIETGVYLDYPTSPSPHGHNEDNYFPTQESPESKTSRELHRKRGLVRPERQRIDRDHPNYHYRQHAQNMTIHPSTTGNEPTPEEDTLSSESTEMRSLRPNRLSKHGDERRGGAPSHSRQRSNRPSSRKQRERRKLSRKESKAVDKEEKRRREELDAIRPPTLWNVYCGMVTFWCPDFVLSCFGMPAKAQRRAWREKMGLISVILLICAFVGFLTFGFTQVVCGSQSVRLKINKVDKGYMIFHGKAYDLMHFNHPPAMGIPGDSNILYDLPQKYGGQDGSFLFQNVNGACKGLINAAKDSDVPTGPDGQVGWYFPCVDVSQDGSTKPNWTDPPYLGYSCHTPAKARKTFYNLVPTGEVYFGWEDVKNKSRNLIVYSGNVLDLDLLNWLNKSAVTYPSRFDQLRQNPDVKGADVTQLFQSGADRKVARCLNEIVRVGSVDTDTIGCIASQVVLYVSLVFILSVVLVKFFLALTFQWFLAKRFAAPKTSLDPTSKTRQRQIEDWSDDIYRPGPRMTDSTAPDRSSKRASNLFPTTSRFSSPYVMDRGIQKQRTVPMTMASQNAGGRLNNPNSLYKLGQDSQGTLGADPYARQSFVGSRSSLMLGAQEQRYSTAVSEADGPGPAGFIHDSVVPQPPPEWQPFGYPLAHTMCLVTAYSEGADGLRTTLDSVAMTDYPNSHKTIVVICDGMIKGKGESLSTPEIALSMMGDHAVAPEDVQAFSYVAVASGAKRHNMAKIYAGFYDYGENSVVPPEKQQRVPMMVVVKSGTPDEAKNSKPGNRGKRDSQIILMSFLQKVMFDERMTELEYEMFNGLWKITGISPDYYEMVLMVDADTNIFPDCLTHMVSAMVKDPEIMGLCGETKIANKAQSWVSMIQVFEYVTPRIY